MADRVLENKRTDAAERSAIHKKRPAHRTRAIPEKSGVHESAVHGRIAPDKRLALQRRKASFHGKPLKNYAIIFSALALLIAAAFFAPQVLFQIQDAILCRDTVLTQQESLNVETLSTTYEKSLETRMRNYAEGMAENQNFYVTSQSLPLTGEIRDYVYSDKGLFGQLVNDLANMGLLTFYLWEEDYTVLRWKQYVIYSDDFSKGVNFILWYVELKDPSGVVLKLLADAEDGTIYALKTEGNSYVPEEEGVAIGEITNYIDEICWSNFAMTQIWGVLAYDYACLDDSEMKTFYIMVDEYGWEGEGMADYGYNGNYGFDEEYDESVVEEREAANKEMLALHEEWEAIQDKVQYHRDGEDKVVFRLPYGEASLDVLLKIPVTENPVAYRHGYPDVSIGIRQIYEMIPEFA